MTVSQSGIDWQFVLMTLTLLTAHNCHNIPIAHVSRMDRVVQKVPELGLVS